MNIAYFIIGVATLNLGSCYVLLQVRKGQNHSNVDALIHKVVPAERFDKIVDNARKQFKDYKQFEVKSHSNSLPAGKELESIVFAIKTNDDKKHNERRENNGLDNFWTDIKNVVMDFIKPNENGPNLRSKMEKYKINPKLMQSNGNKEKPSLMYEIESASVLKTLQDALDSKQARRYSDNIARAAAYVYRLIKEA